MKKHWLATIVVVGAFLFGAAIQKGNTIAPLPSQPTIVAKVNLRNITAGIPQTTVFTPTTTGVFRVSYYMVQTVPGDGQGIWGLNWYWSDDAGAEINQIMSVLDSGQTPPTGYGTLQTGYPAAPFIFEAVAGQPVSFDFPINDSNPGMCALTLIVERLE